MIPLFFEELQAGKLDALLVAFVLAVCLLIAGWEVTYRAFGRRTRRRMRRTHVLRWLL